MASVALSPQDLDHIIRALDEYLRLIAEYQEDQGLNMERADQVSALVERLRAIPRLP